MRQIDHNGTAEDVRRLMGAYIPKEDEFKTSVLQAEL